MLPSSSLNATAVILHIFINYPSAILFYIINTPCKRERILSTFFLCKYTMPPTLKNLELNHPNCKFTFISGKQTVPSRYSSLLLRPGFVPDAHLQIWELWGEWFGPLRPSQICKRGADTDSPRLSKDKKDKWVVDSYSTTLTLQKNRWNWMKYSTNTVNIV